LVTQINHVATSHSVEGQPDADEETPTAVLRPALSIAISLHREDARRHDESQWRLAAPGSLATDFFGDLGARVAGIGFIDQPSFAGLPVESQCSVTKTR
jgi:hypothetical protein